MIGFSSVFSCRLRRREGNEQRGHPLTSIDFLPLGAGVFPRAAFLSFSTFLFLVRFLLVHSCRLELFLRRGDGLGPGSCAQDAHRERFGLVLQSKQDQSSAYHTTQATRRKLT